MRAGNWVYIVFDRDDRVEKTFSSRKKTIKWLKIEARKLRKEYSEGKYCLAGNKSWMYEWGYEMSREGVYHKAEDGDCTWIYYFIKQLVK